MIVMAEALERYNKSQPSLTQSKEESAFALFHSGGIYGKHTNSWDLFESEGKGEKEGHRAKDYAEFMRYMMEMFGLNDIVIGAHDWEAAGNATVVDVSASHRT